MREPTGTTGLTTWQAAIRLANHFIASPGLVTGKRLVELGAGAGMLSNVIAKLQSGSGTVVATDFADSVLERLRINVQLSA